jgi:hypothetical protein
MFCMQNGVETRCVMAHDKTNGWWEWWSRGHWTFGAHEEGGLIRTHALDFKKLPIAIRQS